SNASTNQSFASTIFLDNGAQFNTITNCTIRGSASAIIFFGTASATSGVSNNTISNNDIGPAGSNLPEGAINSVGLSLPNAGNVIGFGNAAGTGTTMISGLDNTFRGIKVVTVSNSTATLIQGNTISGIDHTTSFVGNFNNAAAFVAIEAFNNAGLFDISNNVI